jgi:hypothetical protein
MSPKQTTEVSAEFLLPFPALGIAQGRERQNHRFSVLPDPRFLYGTRTTLNDRLKLGQADYLGDGCVEHPEVQGPRALRSGDQCDAVHVSQT